MPTYEYPKNQPRVKFKRYCKTLLLKNNPKLIDEYRKVHSPGSVWPEITIGMKEVGIVDMEIYISGNRLFMIMDTLPDFNHDEAMSKLAKKPRQSDWESLVSRFQETSEDATADEKWQLVERIYTLESC